MLNQIKALIQSKAAQSAALSREGDGHLKADRLDAAEEAYRRALSVDPHNLKACIGLAYVFTEGKDFPQAKDALSRASAIDPGNADAHYMLGSVARQEGDIPAAVQHLERAIQCRPDFEFAYRDLFGALVQGGHGDEAYELVEKAAAACPQSADVHNMRGRVLAARRDYPGAIECFRKASALAPGVAEYHKSLADMLRANGDPQEAIESYRKAVWFDPRFFAAHLALADELLRQDRHVEAAIHYREALAIDPQSATATLSLGVSLQAQGKLDEAIASYRRAIDVEPRMAAAHANLGHLLAAQGASEEAIICYERVLEIDPSSTVAHTLTGLKGGHSDRAPSAYVSKLFDWYASNFDSHLVKTLGYDVPGKLAAALQPLATASDHPWMVLDLGCGTGLVGVALSSMAQSLVGVDLSARMLEKARERGLYERLAQLDIHAMMKAEPPASYDLVVAADVFVYIGKLDELAMEAHRILRPGMYFAFSVESLDALAAGGSSGAVGHDYRLNETGRFAHAACYLERLCASSGFEHLSTTETQVRVSHGRPVEGYLVLWKKSRAISAYADERAPGRINQGIA